ncbi:MAG: DNA alkylation response protein, partial [Beijerinckiaceae bacterium]
GVLAELSREARGLPGVEASVQRVEAGLARSDAQASARAVTQELAVLASVAALAQCAPSSIVEAFARTRLPRANALFGAADLASECEELLERALPAG